MKYIDSCVFIGAYFPDDPNHKVSIEFIEKLNKGEFTGVISIFGLSEIGGFISRNSNPEKAQEFVIELLKLPNLHISYAINFTEFMNSVLMVSIAKGLSGADSIHFIHAISSIEVDEFITLDNDFNKVSTHIKVINLRKQ